MTASIPLENQLLVTKLYVPVTAGLLIPRPRLTNLLDKSLRAGLHLGFSTSWLWQNDAAL